MREAKGNLLAMDCDALCITTNGFVKANGECVMGRGIAKQVQKYLPNIPKDLGKLIKTGGNRVHLIYPERRDENIPAVISFPVKPVNKVCESHNDYVSHMNFKIGDIIAGWACKADPAIIEQSAIQLVELANQYDWETILLPRAGCGAGELNWQDIKPILDSVLDDRFTAVTF